MANPVFTKGSTVEVSSDDPGFHGAWYVATLVDELKAPPAKKKASNTKNKNPKQFGYLIQYDTLLKDDSLVEPLTEIVEMSFIRPLPPRNLRRDDGDFELYDVVDAYHREGWWIGVVKKVIVEGEMRKYIVSFENPPEEVEFERAQLRLHVDWVDCCWQVPQKKALEHKLVDRNATHTSESNNDAHSDFTTPPKGALKKSHSRKNTESNSEMVGAVDASVSSIRSKRIVNSVQKVSHGKRFQSSARVKNLASVSSSRSKRIMNSVQKNSNGKRFQSSADVKNSASVPSSGNKRIMNSIEKDFHGKRFRSSAGSKGNTKAMSSVMEQNQSDATHQDSPLMEHKIITPETREAEDGKSHQKKRGRPPKLLPKRPISSLEGSSCCSPDHRDESLNQTTVTSVGTTDYQQDWPFVKQSPIWATIASLELYQTPPQKPHFSPLKKIKEVQREGLAIAHMVTFGNLVQRLSDLKLTDPVDITNHSLETLVDLEAHGFDVGAIRGRLNKLLSLKSKVDQHEGKLKKVEEEIEKCNGDRSLEVEMNELEVKMQELQEKMVQVETVKKVKEEEIMRLQSNLHLVSEQITDCELGFRKLAATPLQVRSCIGNSLGPL
ncbi:hypothetical protein L1987_60565 [Smallanthus sonchifolius]|uniref:Uncharacterized protein n=1 Tax=Smallanthus sonchifolius TaxID=185202 RepID=A0ACB9D8F4_9ASTR|nr:hypothetical protein L1987_60565 [Smallanthus sonchifolius]